MLSDALMIFGVFRPKRAELLQQLPRHFDCVRAFEPNPNQNRDKLRIRQRLRAF